MSQFPTCHENWTIVAYANMANKLIIIWSRQGNEFYLSYEPLNLLWNESHLYYIHIGHVSVMWLHVGLCAPDKEW